MPTAMTAYRPSYAQLQTRAWRRLRRYLPHKANLDRLTPDQLDGLLRAMPFSRARRCP
jgi:hypothetical protein